VRLVAAVDRFQRRHAWLGFPLAVRQKYAEDHGGYLAATIAYYTFFSVFPLLLVLTTALGYLLVGHPGLQHRIVDSALGQFPVIGKDLTAGSLKGSVTAVGIGVAGALWAGMGAILAAENAFDQLWGVPPIDRPNFVRARLRALGLLLVLGGGLLAATALAGVATADSHFAVVLKVVSIVLSTALDFLLFWAIFRLLVATEVSWRELRVGAALAALGYEALQLGGGYYVGHVLKNATNTYGTFALVIGLLSYIYLAIHVVLLGAEVSVVSSRRLWPRSLSEGSDRPPTPADVAAFEQRLGTEVRRPDEHIVVSPPPTTE
jgi:membrane protein